MSKLSTLTLLLVGCSPGTPPAGPCVNSSDCPPDYVCLFQQCTSPATINANLSAVVLPGDPSLAPQQYLPFELNPTGVPQSSLAIVLHQPQQLSGQFVLPPGCAAAIDAGTAFPVFMDFVGKSIIPGMPWSFSYESDSRGVVSGVLPVFESFQRTISPAVPCAPPILGTQRVLNAGPYDVGMEFTFPAASESLQLTATLTNAEGMITDGGPIGTLVTILPANSAAQALSIPVPVDSAATFDVQIPYAQAGSAPLASLTLSVQPWTGGLRNYPSILMPFAGMIVDAGEPTPRLVAVDGGPLILTLPYDDTIGFIRGTTETPADGGTGTLLPGATVQISSLSLSNCDTDAGACVYQQSTVSDPNDATFTFSSAPPGTYAVTVVPEYPESDEWFPSTVTVDCSAASACDSSLNNYLAAPGLEVSGLVMRPNSLGPFDDEGQVSIYSIPDMSLLSSTRLAPDGGFLLYAPAGPSLFLIVTPDAVTGYPSAFHQVGVLPEQNIEIDLFSPGLLTGSVSLEALDGGPTQPIPGATLLFYYVTSDPDGGEFAIPFGNAVTDALGDFSVIVYPGQVPLSQ